MKDLRYSPVINSVTKWRSFNFNWGERTYIMGILNVTPDSFSDGGEFNNIQDSLIKAELMINQGADVIDVGGESTRPGAASVSVSEEINRVVPVIKVLKEKFSVPVSLDTSKSEVGLKGLEAGADLINDVWAFQRDPKLANVTADFNVPAILMHNKVDSNYSKDIIESMKLFFNRSLEIAFKAGVAEDKIILDPGIGFGKTQEHNREVLSRLGELHSLGFPLLLGTSRKSIIGTILDLPPKDRLEGTLATSTMGIISGVDILRVHDVLENRRVALVTDKIVRINNG
ncbi:MAG: dihydropteroate synthase [Spirochaetaceae bacterium]